ncbi:zinc-dependent metalloprotease [Temperatibacter marinus]|uniref:Zinc-dependent metalloprotease n=1 Tax=Temperatibacter marinus TaxID=1456591 RepID=A0AA52EG11_9PROT|nr:zinc-dependent metalloprotease [Temperatibacter marinus]WND02448.1 zinc-dependent metalloprotease [Temperatibacter marinus]
MKTLDKTLKGLMTSVALLSITAVAMPSVAFDDGDKPGEEKPKKDKPKKEDNKKKDDKKSDKKADGKDAKKDGKDAKKKKKKKKKTISEVTKDFTVKDGFFKLYEDPKTGKLKMEISKDHLGKEFIYNSVISNGVVEGGHFTGQYRANAVMKFVKVRDTIELHTVNTSFHFDKDQAIARAEKANRSDALSKILKIEAKSKDKKAFLVDATAIFKGEGLDPIKRLGGPRPRPGQFTLGKMNPKKSKINFAKSFKDNTAVKVDYVYSTPRPTGPASAAVVDSRNVNVSVHHAFVRMPEDNGFIPRMDDPRIGYFLDSVTSLTDRSATPWRDMVNRWHLEKKDPTQAVSEVKEPITWWIENTTPVEYRDVIKKATLAWNEAFESAGLKNAIAVKVQPDDADWTAEDINYNVLRWTSSPQPPFGGYGPSFTNPRTGQILGADIMLEYSFITNRVNQSKIFENAFIKEDHVDEEANAFMAKLNDHAKHCNASYTLQMNNLVGQALAAAQGRSPEESKKIVEESLYYLILHEVGHTLGLNHNMKATQARSFAEKDDISKQGDGLVGSVMDYPAINFAPKGKDQAHYYTVKPGPYDHWAIQFGYSPDMEDPAKRKALLSRSTEPKLAFGNDADDMRAPGKAIDPRVNIYDMTDDAVAFASERLASDKAAMETLKDKVLGDADNYQFLRNSYAILTGDMLWQGRVVSRYVGGVYVDRSEPGQEGAVAPYRPVPLAKQKEAMKVLREQIFAPDAFEASAELISHLAIKRRGFNHFAITEDPKLLMRTYNIHRDVMSQLLHPRTITRLSDTQMYGNEYSAAEMMDDLSAAVFEDDIRNTVNGVRQNLQLGYVNSLIGMLSNPAYDFIGRSSALYQLKSIRKDMDRARTRDISTRAHRDHIKLIIDKALEVNNG